MFWHFVQWMGISIVVALAFGLFIKAGKGGE